MNLQLPHLLKQIINARAQVGLFGRFFMEIDFKYVATQLLRAHTQSQQLLEKAKWRNIRILLQLFHIIYQRKGSILRILQHTVHK